MPPKLPKLEPLPHQDRVADKLQDDETPGQLAYHGIGTGKTFTAIHAARKANLPILAITPAALRNNFKKELDASGFQMPSQVVSYQEAMNRAKDPAFRQQAGKSMVVFDEAHRMGQVESQRSQLAKLIPSAKRMLLTASPIRNRPEEVAPLINAVSPGSLPEDPASFNKQFVQAREVPVGFWGRLRGMKPGIEKVPVNLDQFASAVRGKVDYHENIDRTHFPSFSESIVEVPMKEKQQAAYDYLINKYPALAYKVRHGIPPSRSEEQNFTAFFSGPRQVSNHPGQFNASASDVDAPKFQHAADEIEKRHKNDPNFRGVVYSNFLESGVDPMFRELDRRGIKAHRFTGELTDKKRKEIIEDYNSGKTPVLLISGAGAEGLDLKGTKLMQILEPHWNEEQMEQVRGRAIRYRSHSHLPEEERHVEVQRFHAVPVRGFIGRMLTSKPHDRGIDQYLYEMAKRKRDLNQPFLDVLQEEGKKEAAAILAVEFEQTKEAGPFTWAAKVPRQLSGLFDGGHRQTAVQKTLFDMSSSMMPTAKMLDSAPGRAAGKAKSMVGGMMSKLFPNDPLTRYDYSHELKSHALELEKATGVPHTPWGNVDWEHPKVKDVADAVWDGRLQAPKHLMENHNGVTDEVGLWHWSARVAEDAKKHTGKFEKSPVKLPKLDALGGAF